MLTLLHINKHIGRQHVLNDVSFSISEGEVVGLLGPNGAGKSTLMKLIVGLWDADQGGQMTVPARIGYLPEQNPLYDEMYVREYLQFIAHLQHSDESIEELISRVGLTPEANKRISSLSKGYRQRVGLAAAMMGHPQLLILDEPTTGLDPNQLLEIRALIRSLSEHSTVILSTHILQEVREMCSRVIILDHGCIRTDQPLQEVADLEQLFHQSTNQEIHNQDGKRF